MCRIPAGEGLGGRKARVMMGVKGMMWSGMWCLSKWSTGPLGAVVSMEMVWEVAKRP